MADEKQIISEYMRGLAKKRAASQSPKRRREIARNAIRTRWQKKKKKGS